MIASDARPRKPRTAREAKMSPRERRAAAGKARDRFTKARRAEAEYSRKLRHIARSVGHIVESYVPRAGWLGERLAELTATLEKYADLLGPWARAISARMIADVARRDARAWAELGEEMSASIRREIEQTPVGHTFRALQDAQVDLITSLPRVAAERVHRLTLEGLSRGDRGMDLAREVRRTGPVTVSRAELIARTETARAATNFTQARAMYLGSVEYVWRTSRDANVRPSHRAMEGKVVRWDNPPTLDELTGHAGTTPNCRCGPEPILPLDL